MERIFKKELIAQSDYIQEKLDQGWPAHNIWRLLWSDTKFTGNKDQFRKLVSKYFANSQLDKSG